MHCESPFYLFDPSSIGSLYRRDRAGETVPMADLKRIFDNDPDLFRDPVLQKHFEAVISGNNQKSLSGANGSVFLTKSGYWELTMPCARERRQ